MTTGFARLPDASAFRLTDLRVPACLIEGDAIPADRNGLARVDLALADGRIAAIEPAGTAAAPRPVLSLDGGIALPRLVDAHVHLDKGHIWPRSPCLLYTSRCV